MSVTLPTSGFQVRRMKNYLEIITLGGVPYHYYGHQCSICNVLVEGDRAIAQHGTKHIDQNVGMSVYKIRVIKL